MWNWPRSGKSMMVDEGASCKTRTAASAAFSPFLKDPGRAKVGRTFPFPDAAEGASLAIANDRLVVRSGPTGNSYIRLL